MISHIYFIRHAITEGNQKNWYYGQLDIPLAPEGFELIERLSGEGLYPPADGADCYTTGLIRTEQTFKAIYGDIPHEQIKMLQEMNFGAWEGMSFEEIKNSGIYREAFDEWCSMGLDDSVLFKYPEGESVKEFYERIEKGLDELRGKHRLRELAHRHDGKDAVSIMVCHGGVISAIMLNLFPGQKENIWKWTPNPGHGYTVYFEDSEPVSYKQF
jgi:alpha-ribazole phosphatase